EVADSLLRREDDRRTGSLLYRPQPFVTQKEERFVVNNWTAERRAELVLLQDVLRQRRREEVVSRIHCGIPEKLKHIAVESIRAGLDLYIDVGPGVAAILRRVVARLNAELLNRVDRGIKVHVIVTVIHHRDSIH